MKWNGLGLGVVFAVLASTGLAAADETSKAKPGEHWIAPVVIHGRQMRPLAVTELNRVLPAVKLSPLRQPLVGRIEGATEREPF